MSWHISVYQIYIDVKNKWISLGIGLKNIIFIFGYGFPNLPFRHRLFGTPVDYIFGKFPTPSTIKTPCSLGTKSIEISQ